MKKLLYLLIIPTLFTGCFLKSVHPLVPSNQAILIDGIEGTWETEDQRWTIFRQLSSFPDISISGELIQGTMSFKTDGETPDGNGYYILFENLQDLSADTVLFVANIASFNGKHFMDLNLLDIVRDQSFENYHLLPVHTFSRISVNNQELSVEFFEDKWIKKLIEDNRARIKHEKVEDEVLITASTDELQKFILKYGSDEKAFEDPMILKHKIQ